MSLDNYIKFPNEVTFFVSPEELIKKRKYKRAFINKEGKVELYSFIFHGKNYKNHGEYNYTLLTNGISDRIIRTGSFKELFEENNPIIWAGVIKERSEIENLLKEKIKNQS